MTPGTRRRRLLLSLGLAAGISPAVTAQDVFIRQVTDDEPGRVRCTDPERLPPGAGDRNNMPQAEVMLDVSEAGVVAATAKDYRYGPIDSTIYNDGVWSGLYWSADAGAGWRNLTFQDQTPNRGIEGTTTGFGGSGEPLTLTHQSDPVVAFDRDGNLYTCALAFEPDAPEPNIPTMPAGVVVSRRDREGRFVTGSKRFVVLETSPLLFADKNWLAVDRSSPRASTVVVVSWRLFAFSDAAPALPGGYIAVSGDGGDSFTAPIRLPIPAFAAERSQMYQPLVGPDPLTGRKAIYVAFRVNLEGGLHTVMQLLKADIEGQTGTAELGRRLEDPVSWSYLPDRVTGVLRTGSDGQDGSFRYGTYFMPALDRESGYLFVVTHSLDESRQASRVVVSRSIDGGVTWSPIRQVDSPATGHQFMPTMAAGNGIVSLLWYDSRHDPSFAPDAILRGIDVYYAELTEGLELIRVLRLTPTTQQADHPVFTRTRPEPSSFDTELQQEGLQAAPEDAPRRLSQVGPERQQAPLEPYGFIGDYIGLATDAEFAYAAWTDLRALDTSVSILAGNACDGRRNQNIFFARIRKSELR